MVQLCQQMRRQMRQQMRQQIRQQIRQQMHQQLRQQILRHGPAARLLMPLVDVCQDAGQVGLVSRAPDRERRLVVGIAAAIVGTVGGEGRLCGSFAGASAHLKPLAI